MKKLSTSIFVAMLAVFATAIGNSNPSQNMPNPAQFLKQLPNGLLPSPYEPNQVLIKFRQDVATQYAVSHPTITVDSVAAMLNGMDSKPISISFKESFAPTGWTLWNTTPGTNIASLSNSLSKMKGVYGAEPVYLVHKMLVNPNDGDYGQYELNEVYYGDEDPYSLDSGPFLILWNLTDVNAMAGWGVYPNTWYTANSLPSYRPKIAILDTGLDFSHPDLINAGGSGPDISQGGQVDVADSGSVVGGVWTPGTAAATDGNGHGTHVFGLALASGNNGSDPLSGHGMIGTGYPCQGLIIQVLPASGQANSDADLGAGIMRAADDGAEVINMSLGETPYSQFMQDMVNYAFQKGSLVVAAGNENGNGGGALPTDYPAGCTSALAVTANGPDHVISSFSGNGQYIDIAAPGGDVLVDWVDLTYIIQPVWSTVPTYTNFELYDPSGDTEGYPINNRYAYLLGTSMATPQVSGAAGLYYAENNLTVSQGYSNVKVFRALEHSADNTDGTSNGVWDPVQGYGSLDMNALMRNSNPRGATLGAIKGIVYDGGTAIQNVQVTAQLTSGGQTFNTTTMSDGTYRFAGMPAGTYVVTASPFGLTKHQLCQVDPGSDAMGVDLWCGTYSGDVTPPTISYFNISNVTGSSVSFKQWGYDVDTSIASITMQIGTTSGGSDVMGATNIVPDTSDTFSLGNLNLTSGQTYYLTGIWTNGAGLTTVETLPFSYGNAVSISGTITLNNWVGSPQPITVLSREPGSLTTLHSYTVTPNANGTYELNLQDPPGTYDFAFKGAHWLRKVAHNVTVSENGPASVSVSLINGDANGDNVVNRMDVNVLKAAWRSVPGAPNWNPNADLNGDGVVNIGDYTAMKPGYGHHGDP